MPDALRQLEQLRATFLELNPPDLVWEFDQMIVFAIDSAVELCPVLTVGADEDVIVAKRHDT